jgi:hypothetical protein
VIDRDGLGDGDGADGAPDRVSWGVAVAAFLAAALVLVWPWLSGRMTIPWDAKAHFQPQIQFLADSLARGESPFWNPFVFAGHPQVADPQAMIFSPFLVLALLDPSPSLWAVDMAVYATIVLGALCLMGWMRDQRWHALGGLVAALAFGFGAAMAWRVQHTGQVVSLALLPVVLMLLDRAMRRGGVLAGAGAGAVAGLIVLNRDQVALLIVYLLAAFVAWRLLAHGAPLRRLRRAVAPLTAGAVVGLVLVALPVLLTVLVAAESNRPTIDLDGAGRGSLHPALGLTLFVPDLFGASGRMYDYWGPPSYAWNTTGLYIAQNVGQLYVGAAPAILLIVGLLSGIVWHREVRLFTVALAVVVLYALGWYTPVFGLFHGYVPGVDLYRRPADAVFLIGFLAAVLAGYTTHRLLEITRPIPPPRLQLAILATIVVVAAAFVVAGGLALHMERTATANRQLILSAIAFLIAGAVLADAVWLNPIRPALGGLLVAATLTVDLAWFNGPSTSTALPPAHYDVLEPTTRNPTIALLQERVAAGTAADPNRRDRVEMVGLGFHWPNATMTHRLEHTMGYNPLRLADYARATGAEDTVGLPEQRRFSALYPSYRATLVNLLGIRWIVTKVAVEDIDRTLEEGAFPLLAQTADGFVYENPAAFPRVFFARSAQAADFDAILRTGVWPDVDLRSTVLLPTGHTQTGGQAGGLVANRGTGEVRLVRYANTEVVIDVEATRGGYVVLNDVWHPWWIARIGADEVPVLRANVLFRAVRVPAGRHTVRLTFEPIRGALAALRR